jgi:hypothetical protein
VAAHRLGEGGVHPELGLRGEADRPQDPHRVLAQADVRTADHPRVPAPHVVEAADVIDDPPLDHVVGHRKQEISSPESQSARDALTYTPLSDTSLPRDRRARRVGVFLERYGAADLAFSPAAYRALVFYPWPLNVRELEQTAETAIALCAADRIELEHLPEEVQRYAPPRAQHGRGPASEEDRHRGLMRLLAAHNGDVSAVARSMGCSRMQVHRWLKQLDVDPDAYRG